jgi:hypothetical protein
MGIKVTEKEQRAGKSKLERRKRRIKRVKINFLGPRTNIKIAKNKSVGRGWVTWSRIFASEMKHDGLDLLHIKRNTINLVKGAQIR